MALAAPAPCFADQFVLFDVTFTYTKEDADNATPSKSHYYVHDLNPERPTDWTSPVDYRNGTVHIRTEVIDKPAGGEITQWVLCYIPVEGTGNGYGCTGSGTYTEEGLYERDVSMTSWWENESIVWTEGIAEMHLVMKDADDGGGFTHLRPDPEHFFPTTMRITMIQVSAGATYDPELVALGEGGAGGASEGGTAGSESAPPGGGGFGGSAGGASGAVKPSGGAGAAALATGGSSGGATPSNGGAATNPVRRASSASTGSCAIGHNASAWGLLAGGALLAGAALRRRRITR